MPSPASFALSLALSLLSLSSSANADSLAGSIVQVGNSMVSAMMLFVGNEEKVYILDKSENNAASLNGHPAWGAVFDINSGQTELMDVFTNTFCASGLHLPNGSYATFGGNGAIGPNAKAGNVPNTPNDGASLFDTTYQDYDGRKAIRIIGPCTGSSIANNPNCQWFDNATLLAMQKNRWYSTAEALGDGSIAIIGGFVNGGYVNRNFPNTDPDEGGAAENSYEIFPPKGAAATVQFLRDTSGLNAYAHAFLMPSGKMFVQSNLSTMLWDPIQNVEDRLEDMPNGVVRVYPASGGAAMLPLTPANNWTPTILFCGGSNMSADAYGNYSYPFINTFDTPASTDCQRITPEPTDGSTPTYVQDDDLIESRTMGQIIALPDGTMLIVNGGLNGTAGYTDQGTLLTPASQMPFGQSLASGPVLTPAIYNPNAAAGSRWSNAGLKASTIPRLYHSSAVLLPDASVLIAGSNPNLDVNTNAIYPTTYTIERFYPPYFSASVRPVPTGVPTTLTYGGTPFDITVPASSYTGLANDAAGNASVWLMRPGFTTHAMNMGQRSMQLNNTYTVFQNGTIVLHVSQPPPNANILQPGPVFVFTTIHGIPSNGTLAIVGSGAIETQQLLDVTPLPASIRTDNAVGTGSSNGSSSGNDSSTSTSGSSSHTGAIIGGIIAAVAVVGILGAIVGICLARRRRAVQRSNVSSTAGAGGMVQMRAMRASDASAFMPLQHNNESAAWNASSYSLNTPAGMETPYKDAVRGGTPHQEYDPYYEQPTVNAARSPPRRY